MFTVRYCSKRFLTCSKISPSYRHLSLGVTNAPKSNEEFQPTINIIKEDLHLIHRDIVQRLGCYEQELNELAKYHFDSKGKLIRPMIICTMARSFNQQEDNFLHENQRCIATLGEMIHTASLIHDDVVDSSDRRRGKPAAAVRWGARKAVLAGDYILGISSIMLARIGNSDVISLLSRVIQDLVRGEFMQLSTKESDAEQFQDYLNKTFCKTASLFANTCKAAALLGNLPNINLNQLADYAYEFGKNFGMAFQLIDDLLDVTATDDDLGKPATADLKLGLSTAPVLFASQQFPELQTLILRRFSEMGDIERAVKLIDQSDGKARTYHLAEQYANEACRMLNNFPQSSNGSNRFLNLLIYLTQSTLKRRH
ncbi:unnamed protein product [Rotaria sp. Silwood2]|nr:unnamed protein product [Rotaria sp. Silwood2]CAF3079866.1 unnamed protein product [Rotaria sp. Silwood2]CAF3894395.1 unnamed protein product [Rotaria sp. Silwood2]CAF3946183.1 unnamed protein product [Rotaria sp. Silwood2]